MIYRSNKPKGSLNTRTLLLGSFAALGSLGFRRIRCNFGGISFGGIRRRFGSWCLLGGAGSLRGLGLNKGVTEHGVDSIGRGS